MNRIWIGLALLVAFGIGLVALARLDVSASARPLVDPDREAMGAFIIAGAAAMIALTSLLAQQRTALSSSVVKFMAEHSVGLIVFGGVPGVLLALGATPLFASAWFSLGPNDERVWLGLVRALCAFLVYLVCVNLGRWWVERGTKDHGTGWRTTYFLLLPATILFIVVRGAGPAEYYAGLLVLLACAIWQFFYRVAHLDGSTAVSP